MTKKLLATLFTALAVSSSLHAQTPAPAPTPPLPPLIKRAPDKAQWVITYKLQPDAPGGPKAEPGKPPASPPMRRLVIKNPGLILERTLNENGVAIDTWHLQNGVAVTAVQGKNWTPGTSAQPGFDGVDYSSNDFAGFDWMTPQNFVGLKDIAGKHCLVFQGKVVTIEPSQIEAIKSGISRDFTWMSLDNDGNAKANPGARQPVFNMEDYKYPVMAYIEDETRLPVALVYKTPQGTITRTYEFQPPTALPSLPPEVQSVLKGSLERQRRMSLAHAPI